MPRYIFAAEFASPQEGPRFDLVPPFDKHLYGNQKRVKPTKAVDNGVHRSA